MEKIHTIAPAPLETTPTFARSNVFWSGLRLAGLILLLSGIVPITARAATLYLSPSSDSYYKGKNFEVHILVSSDAAINAVSGVLNFPTRYLKVIEISKKNSILNFWVEEPSFSNAGELGNIRFEGVVLNPGFTGTGGTIADVIFRADSAGSADISFTQSAILANDGLGTNILAGNSGAHVTVLPAKLIQEPAPQPQMIIVRELQQEKSSDLVLFWETLPTWVRVSIAISIGLSTIVIMLIVLSFGAMVLIWLWANIWHLKTQFLALLRLPAHVFKNFVFGVLRFLGMAEREIEEDFKYGLDQLLKEIKRAPQTLSFRSLVKNYFFSLGNVVKHVFRKNSAGTLHGGEQVVAVGATEVPREHGQDLGNAHTQNLDDAEKSVRNNMVNPARSSHGALNPVFAETKSHSSPRQAAERSASGGVKKLHVGGLSHDTSEQDFRNAFAKAGTVVFARVIADTTSGHSKRFGVVEMATGEEARKAIEMWNGKELGGRILTVNEARPQEPRAPR